MISGFANASEIFIVFLNWVFLYIHTNTHATKANKHATKTNNYVIRLDNKYNAKKNMEEEHEGNKKQMSDSQR